MTRPDLTTPEGIRAEYDRMLRWLEEIISASELHEREMPDCPALPLCIGSTNLIAMRTTMMLFAGSEQSLVMVAVHELTKARAEIRQLKAVVQNR